LYISVKQLLIASQNEDTRSLFTEYFQSQGQTSIVVDSRERCLDELKNRSQNYDVIILDTDLIDINEIDLARKILTLVPAQKVVITTGFEDHALKREAELIGIKKEKILLKPFKLSKLWSAAMDS
jgi:DNA-binding NtrC family response regulator